MAIALNLPDLSTTSDITKDKDTGVQSTQPKIAQPVVQGTQSTDTTGKIALDLPPMTSAYEVRRIAGSKYDLGTFPDTDLEVHRAEQQPGYEKIGAGIWNFGIEFAGGVLKSTSYLANPEYYSAVFNNSTDTFKNDFADAVDKVVQKHKAQIYRSQEQRLSGIGGFNPTDGGWWGEAAPGIGNFLSMVIPAGWITKGFGAAAELMGGMKLLNSVGMGVSEAKNISMFTNALVNNHLMNLMGSHDIYNQTYQEAYDKLIKSGMPEEEAKRKAELTGGDAASSNYKLGFANMALELPAFGVIFASFGNAAKMASLEEAAAAKVAKDGILKTAAKSGAYMGAMMPVFDVIGKEAERNALINNGIIKDDGTDIASRILNYASNDNWLTSFSEGFIGGAIAGGMKAKEVRTSEEKRNTLYNDLMQLHKNVILNDPDGFMKTTDTAFFTAAMDHLGQGTLDKYINSLDILSKSKFNALENPIFSEDDFNSKVRERLADAKFLKDASARINNEYNLDADLKGFKIGHVLSQRLTERRIGELETDINRVLGSDAEKGNKLAGFVTLKKDLFELRALRQLVDSEGKPDARFADRIKALEDRVNSTAKIIKEDNVNFPDIKTNQDIEKALSTSNDDILNHKIIQMPDGKQVIYPGKFLQKALHEQDLADTKDNLEKLKTPEGRQSVKNDIANVRKNNTIRDISLKMSTGQELSPTEKKFYADNKKIIDDLTSRMKEAADKKAPAAPSTPVSTVKNEAVDDQEHILNELIKREANANAIERVNDGIRRKIHDVNNQLFSKNQTIEYLQNTLQEHLDSIGDKQSTLANKIQEYINASTKESPKSKEANLARMQERYRETFRLANDIQNRIRELQDDVSTLEASKKDLEERLNYYSNLINDPSLKTLSLTELKDKRDKVQAKLTAAQEAIQRVKKFLDDTIHILKDITKTIISRFKALTDFAKETQYKESPGMHSAIKRFESEASQIKYLLDLEKKGALSDVQKLLLANYAEISREYQRLEAEVNNAADFGDIHEKDRQRAEADLDKLNKNIIKYQNQVRYLDDLFKYAAIKNKSTDVKVQTRGANEENAFKNGTVQQVKAAQAENARNTDLQETVRRNAGTRIQKVGDIQPDGTIPEAKILSEGIPDQHGFRTWNVSNPDGSTGIVSGKNGWRPVNETTRMSQGKEILHGPSHFNDLFKFNWAYEQGTLADLQVSTGLSPDEIINHPEFKEAFPAMRAFQMYQKVLALPKEQMRNHISLVMLPVKDRSAEPVFERTSEGITTRGVTKKNVHILLRIQNPDWKEGDPLSEKQSTLFHPYNPDYYEEKQADGTFSTLDIATLTPDKFKKIFGFDHGQSLEGEEGLRKIQELQNNWKSLQEFVRNAEVLFSKGVTELPVDSFDIIPIHTLDKITRDPQKGYPKLGLTDSTPDGAALFPELKDTPIFRADRASVYTDAVPDYITLGHGYYTVYEHPNGSKIFVRLAPKEVLVKGNTPEERLASEQAFITKLNKLEEELGKPEYSVLKADKKVVLDKINELNVFIQSQDPGMKLWFTVDKPVSEDRYRIKVMGLHDDHGWAKDTYESYVGQVPDISTLMRKINSSIEFTNEDGTKIHPVLTPDNLKVDPGYDADLSTQRDKFLSTVNPGIVKSFSLRFAFHPEKIAEAEPSTVNPVPSSPFVFAEDVGEETFEEAPAKPAGFGVKAEPTAITVSVSDIERRRKLSMEGGTTKQNYEVFGVHSGEGVDTNEDEYIDKDDNIILISGNTKQERINEINARYDAELSALKGKAEPVETAKDDPMLTKEYWIERNTPDFLLSLVQAEDINDPKITQEDWAQARYMAEQSADSYVKAHIKDLITQGKPVSKAAFKIVEDLNQLSSPVIPQEVFDLAKRELPEGINVHIEDLDTLKKLTEATGTTVGAVIGRGIHMADVADKGVYFHESFHIVFRNLIDDFRANAILRKVKSDLKLSPEQLQTELQKLSNKDPYYKTLSTEELEQAFYEEHLADKYADWRNGRETKGFLKLIFRKITDIINYLRNPKIYGLFQKIERGDFKESDILSTKYNSTGTDSQAFKLLGALTQEQSVSLMHTLFGKSILLPYTDIQTLINEQLNLHDIKIDTNKAVLDKMANPGKARVEMLKVYRALADEQNQLYIKEQVQRFRDTVGYDPEKRRQNNLQDPESREREFDRNASNIDPSENVLTQAKQFIASTLYEDKDQFNRVVLKGLPWRDLYNGLLPLLSEEYTPQEDIMKKLQLMSTHNPKTKALFNRLQQVTGWSPETPNGPGNPELLQAFKKAFQQVPKLYLQGVQHADGSTSAYPTNTKDLADYKLLTWGKDFNYQIDNIYKAGKSEITKVVNNLNLLLEDLKSGRTNIKNKEYLESYPDRVHAAKAILDSIGIDIKMPYLLYSFGETAEASQFKEAFKNVTPINPEFISRLVSFIKNSDNPFAEGNTGMLSTLRDIAMGNLPFDEEAVLKTYTDGNGKTRYSFSLPSMVDTKVRDIKDIFSNADKLKAFKESNNGYFSHNAIVLDPNAPDIINALKAYLSDDIRKERVEDTDEEDDFEANPNIIQEGRNSRKLVEDDLIILLHNYFSQRDGGYAYYRSTQIESKGTQHAFKLPVKEFFKNNEFTQDAKNALWNMFMQEHRRLQGDFGKDFLAKGYVMFPMFNDDAKVVNVKNPETVKNYVLDVITKTINNDINDHLDYLNNTGLIKHINQNVLKGYADNKAYVGNFVLNNIIWNNAIMQLIRGDVAWSKDYATYIKRNSGVVAFGHDFGGESHRVAYVKDFVKYRDTSTENKEVNVSKLSKEEIDRRTKLPKEDPQALREDKITDGVVYSSMPSKIDDLKRLGKSNPDAEKLYNKIMSGQAVSIDEVKQYNLDLIPSKQVTYGFLDDGFTKVYHKMSVFYLSKEYTSYLDANNTWQPKLGLEKLHNIREFIEGNNLTHLVHQSASKEYFPKKALDHSDFERGVPTIDEADIHSVPNIWRRLQLDNHTSYKKTVPLFKQVIDIIGSQLTDADNIDKSKQIKELIAKTKANTFDKLLSVLIDKTPDGKTKKADLEAWLRAQRKSGEDSNITNQQLTFLSNNGPNMAYDTNIPFATGKQERLFLSTFKRAFKTEISGRHGTQASANGVEFILEDENGKIVPREEYNKNPEAYAGKLKSRQLRNPGYDADGNYIPGEILMTRKYAQLHKINIGSDTHNAINGKVMGIHVPTPGYSSIGLYTVPDFLPDYYGDTVIIPELAKHIQNADFDIDAMYIWSPAWFTNRDGNVVVHGSESTPEDKYDGYIADQMNFPYVKDEIRNSLLNNAEYQKSLQDVKTYLTEKSEYKINKELTKRFEKAISGLLETDPESSDINSLSHGLLISRFIRNNYKPQYEAIKMLTNKMESIENAALESALKRFKLPSTQAEFEKSGYTTESIHNNKILDLTYDILSSKELKTQMMTPLGTEDIKQALEDKNKLVPEPKNVTIPNSPKAILESFRNNTKSVLDRGKAVTSNATGQFLTEHKVTLDEKFAITANGQTRNSFGTNKEETFSKAIWGEQGVQGVIDNAKDPIVTQLNLGGVTIGPSGVLNGLGFEKTFISKLLYQPSILEVSKMDEETKGLFTSRSGNLDSIITEQIGKYNSRLNSIRAAILGSKDFSAQEKDELLDKSKKLVLNSTEEDFKKSVVQGIDIGKKADMKDKKSLISNLEYYSTQVNALNLFDKTNTISSAKSKLSKIMTLNRGVDTRIQDLDSYLDAYDELVNGKKLPGNKRDTPVFSNIKEVLDNNPNVRQNLEHIRQLREASKHFFLKGTNFFKPIVQRVTNLAGGYLKDYQRSMLDNDLHSALVLAVLTKGKPMDGILKLITPGEGSLNSKIQELLKTDKELKENPFIRSLVLRDANSQYNRTPLDRVMTDSRTKYSGDTQDKLTDGHLSLMSTHKDIADDIFRYEALVNNFQMKEGSLLTKMTPEAFLDLAKKTEELNKLLAEPVPSSTRFKELTGYTPEQFTDNFMKNFKMRNDFGGMLPYALTPEKFKEFSAKMKTKTTKVTPTEVKPTIQDKPTANIPQNKVSGVESYGSTVTAAPNVIKALGKNPHSIDMIEAGLRTRTTRSESEMAKYSVKVGDVIKNFGTSADGTTKEVLARVTAVHPKGTPGWKGTWAKEGWSQQDINVLDRFKNGAAAIEFEVIKPTEAATREYTPENITSLKPNEVFVFGSNTEGRHGAGAAKTAVDKFGAKYGQAEGLQGQSYAIVTKNLTSGIEMFGRKITKTGERSIERFEIREQLEDLMSFAENNPDKKFYVTKLGTALAGFSTSEIKELFEKIKDIIPDNVILPKEFEVRDELRSDKSSTKTAELPTNFNLNDADLGDEQYSRGITPGVEGGPDRPNGSKPQSTIVTNPAFETIKIGDYKGKEQTKERVQEIDNKIINTPDEKIGGNTGESFNDLFKRVINEYNRLKSTDGNSAIVTHNSIFGLITAYEEWKNKTGEYPTADNKEFRKFYTEHDLKDKTGVYESFKKDNGDSIYIVRHGQTQDNVDGLFRRDETPLTDKGKQQAIDAGESLKSVDLKDIHSSPVERTQETSQRILEAQEPVKAEAVSKEKPTEEKPIEAETKDKKQIDRLFKDLSAKLEGKVTAREVTPEEAEAITKKPLQDTDKAFYKNGVTYYIKGRYSPSDVIHEFAHPVVDVLAHTNTSLFNKLVYEYLGTPEAKSQLDEVRKYYPENFDADGTLNFKGFKEMLTRAIEQEGAKNLEAAKDKTLMQRIMTRILNGIKQAFRFLYPNARDLSKLDYNTSIKELADMLTEGKRGISMEELPRTSDYAQYKREKIEKDEPAPKLPISKTLDDVKLSLYTQIRIYEDRGKAEQIGELKELYKKLENINELSALSDYIQEAHKYTKDADTRLQQIKKSTAATVDTINALQNIYEYISGYDVLDEIRNLKEFTILGKDTSGMSKDHVISVLNEAITRRDAIKDEYFNQVIPKLAQQLWDYLGPELREYKNKQYSKEFFEKELQAMSKDESAFRALLDPMSTSPNVLLGTFAKMTARMKDTIDKNSIEANNKLRPVLKKFYEETGRKGTLNAAKLFAGLTEDISTYKKIEEVDADGNVTGFREEEQKVKHFVREVDYNKFYKEKRDFFNNLEDRHKKGQIDSATRDKAIARWYDKFTEVVPDAEDIIKNNKEIMTEDQFKAWESDNIKVNPLTGEIRYTGELRRPKLSLFKNEAWEKMLKTPGLKSYYDSITKEYLDAQKTHPDSQKPGLRLPSVPKSIQDIFIEEGAKAASAEALRRGFNWTEQDIERGIQNQQGEEVEYVPMHYNQVMDASKVSNDIHASVQKYIQMSLRYNEFRKHIGVAEALKDVLQRNRPIKTNLEGKPIQNALATKIGIERFLKKEYGESTAYKYLNNFVDMLYYGKTKNKGLMLHLFGKDISVDKTLDSLAHFSRLEMLAGKISPAVNLSAILNINRINVAFGGTSRTEGRFYNLKNYANGKKKFASIVHQLLGDVGKQDEALSLWGQLVQRYDPIQGTYKRETGEIVTGNAAKQLFSKSPSFMLNHFASYEATVTGMLSMMDHQMVDVIDDKGNKSQIKLIDAYELDKDGIVKLKDGVQWSDDQLFQFKQTMHGITRSLHGANDDMSLTALHKMALGRLALMFKNFVVPAFRSRFDARKPNIEMDAITEGYHRTFFNVLLDELKVMKDKVMFGVTGKDKYGKSTWISWNDLDPLQKENMRRSLADVVFMVSTGVIVASLSSTKKHKRNNSWVQNYTLYQCYKLSSELEFYENPADFWRIIKSPTGAMTTVQDVTNLLTQAILHPTERYQKKTGGYKKGELKIKGRIAKLIPVLNQIESLKHPEEAAAWYRQLKLQ